ncbi:D-alanyl-D-alanine carboxypeptidase family protein [Methylopila sp. M107]|uniref:D-alanyl-D-alanine carboxypeptidase family protein n=1 Tax=Methylopila sp. M107 TaxID=1101190 RepID=UPI00039A92AD|nr:D-alanyl-D-alanine carboxypeptidase family protein [Methylopila sp. M107]
MTTSIRRRAAACVFALMAGVGSADAAAAPLLVADIASGQVLEAREATTPWYPASLTKLMTTYVVLNAVKAGKLTLQQSLVYTERAQKEPPSKMGFQVGQTVTVDDALKMLMVQSANDIAFILAEGVSGSVEAFVVEMNRTARQIGMTGSNFVNPNGLPVKPGPDLQRTTARDMAILATALYRDHPQMAGLFALDAIKIGQRTMRNHNGLMGRYPGTDGMKTGYVCSSGYNVVATASRGGRRLVTIVFGAYSPLERSETAVDAFERGFAATKAVGTLATLPSPPQAFPIDLREEMCGKAGAKIRTARRLMLEAHPWAPALMSKPAVSPVMVYATPAPGKPDTPAEPSGVDEDAPAAAKAPALAATPGAKKPAAAKSATTPAKGKPAATKKPAPAKTKTGRVKIELEPAVGIKSSAAVGAKPAGAL